MATPQKTVEKRVNAVRMIEESSSALAKRFGVEISPMPNIGKFDADYGRAVELEHLGNVLKSIADAAGKSKANEKENKKVNGVA